MPGCWWDLITAQLILVEQSVTAGLSQSIVDIIKLLQLVRGLFKKKKKEKKGLLDGRDKIQPLKVY